MEFIQKPGKKIGFVKREEKKNYNSENSTRNVKAEQRRNHDNNQVKTTMKPMIHWPLTLRINLIMPLTHRISNAYTKDANEKNPMEQ